MATQQVLGLWLSLTTVGTWADRPVAYKSDANMIFYLAEDQGDAGTLYFATKDTFVDGDSWTPVASAGGIPSNADVAYDAVNHTLVLANIPTSDPGVEGALWSDEGVVTVSAGA